MPREASWHFEWRGRGWTIPEIARETGIDRRLLYYRIVTCGDSVEDTVKPRERPYTRYTLRGERMTLEGIERALHFGGNALRKRAKKNGTTIQEEIDREAERQGGAR